MFLAIDIPGEAIPIVAIGLGAVVMVIWIIAATISEIITSRGQERSRREIAAYIAEGTMSPDEGERILKAAPPKAEC